MVAESIVQNGNQESLTDVDDTNGGTTTTTDNNNDDGEASLCIPITTSTDKNLFVEIFASELVDISATALGTALTDEKAPLKTWSDAALMYIRENCPRDSIQLLKEACRQDENLESSKQERVRALASAGIAQLSSNTEEEDWRSAAELYFTRAVKVDQLFPMTWIGRGMLNLSFERYEQAKFFFKTTLEQCGPILPALLGMAAVHVKCQEYEDAQELYGQCMRLEKDSTHQKAGARVGFAYACYKLGQIDRAKAAYARAYQLDRNNVEAMLGLAILDMRNLDEQHSDNYRAKMENCMKLISMANLVNHNHAMVQNHLANHYFTQWTPVPGILVDVTQGSTHVTCRSVAASTALNNLMDAGEHIRIGTKFTTHVVSSSDTPDGKTQFTLQDVWSMPSENGLKLWKKDYDRVVALAKGAYATTAVQEIQAESLLLLGRVHHVKNDFDQARKYYERACKLAPDLSPARFGLAQTLIWEETHEEAAAHLRLVLGTMATATNALAALGLLEVVQNPDKHADGLTYLKKAMDLEPLNPDLVLLEALALQHSQKKSEYPAALERYTKAVNLMENLHKRTVPWEVRTNMGVLCHETKKFTEAEGHYAKALDAIAAASNKSGLKTNAEIASTLEKNPDVLFHEKNKYFWEYLSVGKVQIKLDGEKQVFVIQKNDDDPDHKSWQHLKDDDNIQLQIISSSDTENDEETPNVDFESTIKSIDKDKLELTLHNKMEAQEENVNFQMRVKRSNNLLSIPSAISVAFNLARLHEASGHTIPAVELHKAIVKRHPSYVNSYLRLACIARDCGSLPDCSEWLKSACAVAPGNPEVLTLVGNLHLSLCDWAPAQSVFDQLLAQKVPNVEAYSMLSLGNIYFNNLHTPKKYSKHLHYAADLYKRILTRDKANAYAANGLGTVLAEKGEIIKAKEVFNRVREVSGDTILDTLLNLGHIYLAQKRHPEALQMYQSYMNRTRNTGAPITSKSQDDDDAEVLTYIAFAYFDWARQTEAFNNIKAAPADDRYNKSIEYIEMALKKTKKENLTLRYNWCMVKLQAANCVLQKLTRNIRRTALEVQAALDGLEESLPVVQTMLQWKEEGKKLPIARSMLNDFVSQCKANIESAKSHLSEELKKEADARELRELQRLETETQEKERQLKLQIELEEKAKAEEARERRAEEKMKKAGALVQNWEEEAETIRIKEEKKNAKNLSNQQPQAEEEGLFDTDLPEAEESEKEKIKSATNVLFDDSDDDDDDDDMNDEKKSGGEANDKSEEGDKKIQSSKENEAGEPKAVVGTEKDLFGDSDDEESDEELIPTAKSSSSKRSLPESSTNDETEDATKKRRVLEDSD